MSILIKGMTMPTTGLYFVGVDNTDGRDRTVVTVERMLGNSDVRQIIGSFELVSVPPHGRLIDADELMGEIQDYIEEYSWYTDEHGFHSDKWCAMKETEMAINAAPTIVEADNNTQNMSAESEEEDA